MGSVIGMTKKSYPRGMKIGDIPAVIVPSATRSHFSPQSGNLANRISKATVGIAVLRGSVGIMRAGMKVMRRDSISKLMNNLGSR
jgi:hypothetical protein